MLSGGCGEGTSTLEMATSLPGRCGWVGVVRVQAPLLLEMATSLPGRCGRVGVLRAPLLLEMATSLPGRVGWEW